MRWRLLLCRIGIHAYVTRGFTPNGILVSRCTCCGREVEEDLA